MLVRLRFAGLLLGVGLLFALSGCGLFGGDGEGIDPLGQLIDFGEEPVEEAALEEILVVEEAGAELRLVQRPEVLIEVQYFFGHQINLEAIERNNGELLELADYGGPGDVDLDWVIEVHRETEESDFLFQYLAGVRVPATHKEFYEDFHFGMLDVIHIASVGSNRLLAASVLVGPEGRTLRDLSEREQLEFQRLIREGRFYINEANAVLDRELENIRGVASGMRVR